MRRPTSFIALLLALLWLPATLHCAMEAAGVLGDTETSCCQHEKSPGEPPVNCSHDTCGLVEDGDYQPAHNFLKISAPVAVICFSCLIEIAPETTIVPVIIAPAEVESPPEIRRTWQFLARAALSPRAPSFVC